MSPPPPPLPPGVTAVRLLWTDYAGVRRCRVVPASRWAAVAAAGVSLARCCVLLQTTADAVAEGAGVDACGDCALTPATAPVALPWHPRHAAVVCDLRLDGGAAPFSLCPRACLARAVAAAEAAGLSLRCGVESEFLLRRRRGAEGGGGGGGGAPPPTNYAHTLTLDAAAPVLDAIVDAIAEMGVATVEQWHGESGAAGFEVVTTHAPPLAAADGLVLTREAVCQVAARAGYDAVFLPKPGGAGEAGQGAHVHVSVWAGGDNVTRGVGAPAAADPRGAAFVAGVLHHLPALLAITAGGPTSALRRAPGCWAGAFSCWGGANKEAPLRVLPDRFELKAVDATANPYLALAAIIAAGLDGVRTGAALPPPVDARAAATGAAPADGSGPPPPPLPATTADAVAALLSEAHRGPLEATLGAGVIDAVAALREADGRALAGWPTERVVAELALTY